MSFKCSNVKLGEACLPSDLIVHLCLSTHFSITICHFLITVLNLTFKVLVLPS